VGREEGEGEMRRGKGKKGKGGREGYGCFLPEFFGRITPENDHSCAFSILILVSTWRN